MVSHTIMTIIQCMIMAYVLTIGQVQTLQPVDASLSRATCDDVLTKSSWENPITAIHGHFFLKCMASWDYDAL